jgi:hypothetical protein
MRISFRLDDSWAALSEAVSVRRVDLVQRSVQHAAFSGFIDSLPYVQHKFAVRNLHMSATIQSGRGNPVSTHVAMAMTARPISEASKTRHANCMRMGIRILTISLRTKPSDLRRKARARRINVSRRQALPAGCVV